MVRLHRTVTISIQSLRQCRGTSRFKASSCTLRWVKRRLKISNLTYHLKREINYTQVVNLFHLILKVEKSMLFGNGVKSKQIMSKGRILLDKRVSGFSIKIMKIFLFILSLIIPLLFQSAWAADIRLAWAPNNEPDLAGYKVYYGTTSGTYGPPINVGNVTTCPLTGLDPRYTYYFAVTAYDISNRESNFSDEVRWPNLDIVDFNGDGMSDVLWHHATTGQVAIWVMNGTTISSVAGPGAMGDLNWQIKGVGDFDGDGKADVLWQHPSSGTVAIWLMNGTTISSIGVPGAIPSDWQIKN